jgi:hypothetical protein
MVRYWLAAALLFSLPAYISAKEAAKQQECYPFTGKVTGTKVRLRSAPHLESTIIGELHKDDYIQIIGEQAGFFVVAPPAGMKMYVYRTYVFDQTVDANNVNVRLAPSLEAPIAAQLHAGDKVIGKPSSQNPKWIEIDPPATAKIYVAKDYVVKAGGPDFLLSQAKTQESMQAFLVESYREAEVEMKKPFDQMSLDPLIEKLTKASAEWQDMPEQKNRAEELKNLLQETYRSRRLAWFEEATINHSLQLEAKDKERLAEKQRFEQRIRELESLLQTQKESLLIACEQKPAETITLSPDLPRDMPPMTQWNSMEMSLQSKWLAAHPGATVDSYYKSEEVVTLKGTIEPYKVSCKKAPGDFLLIVNGVPIAYLYSPYVDLNVATGKEISLTAVERDNNHFAYPAYCVIQMKHGNS